MYRFSAIAILKPGNIKEMIPHLKENDNKIHKKLFEKLIDLWGPKSQELIKEIAWKV